MHGALAGIATAIAILGGLAAGTVGTSTTHDDQPGTLRWEHQYGTSSNDSAKANATDADGNIYEAGETYGALAGSHAGGADAFIRVYTP